MDYLTIPSIIAKFADIKKRSVVYYPSEFIMLFTNQNIYIDPKLQTKERWSKNDKDSFFFTLRTNTYDDKIILCDIETAIIKALKDNNIEDFNELKRLQNLGYKYISMDGNHRTQLMWKYEGDITEFKHKNIEVVIVMYLSIKEMHDYTIRKNKQKAWNESEKRNAIVSPVSDLIRKISGEYTEITDMLKIKNNRYQNNEFFSQLLLLLDNKYQNKSRPIKPKQLKLLFENGVHPSLYVNFNTVIKIWSKIVKIYYSEINDKRKYRMYWITLFMFIDFVLTNHKDDINDNYLRYVAENFNNVINEIENNYQLHKTGGLFDFTRRNSFDNIEERLEYFITKIY